MNKKGQVFILFVLMLPIIILTIGFAVEISLIGYEKVKIASVTRTIMQSDIASLDKDDIIKLYSENNIEVKTLDLNDGVKVSVEIESFLGKLIDKENYEISVEVKE